MDNGSESRVQIGADHSNKPAAHGEWLALRTDKDRLLALYHRQAGILKVPYRGTHYLFDLQNLK